MRLGVVRGDILEALRRMGATRKEQDILAEREI